MTNLIEVQIDSVRVHLMTPNRLVVLKQLNEERYLPIWVGPYEAEAITIALQEVEVSRPLTHDLLRNVFNVFNSRITRIEIVKSKPVLVMSGIFRKLAHPTGFEPVTSGVFSRSCCRYTNGTHQKRPLITRTFCGRLPMFSAASR